MKKNKLILYENLSKRIRTSYIFKTKASLKVMVSNLLVLETRQLKPKVAQLRNLGFLMIKRNVFKLVG